MDMVPQLLLGRGSHAGTTNQEGAFADVGRCYNTRHTANIVLHLVGERNGRLVRAFSSDLCAAISGLESVSLPSPQSTHSSSRAALTGHSEIYCHPEYASYSPYISAVNMHAPKRGVVIPTLIYRALFKSWSAPIVSPAAALLSWIGTTVRTFASSASVTSAGSTLYKTAPNGPANTQATWKTREEVLEEENWEWSMAEDELLRR